MKVLVLGSSGIIGQHLRLCVPETATPVWHRSRGDAAHIGFDLTRGDITEFLEEIMPEAIINLAGESSTDYVEKNWRDTLDINVSLPRVLASWCDRFNVRLFQVSTQAVFSGTNPPYLPTSKCYPVNRYGCQKLAAENAVLEYPNTIIVRPTFILGVRPFNTGRKNPLEAMLEGQSKQVDDRFFSPLFARDCARMLWSVVGHDQGESRIIHLGIPQKTSRYQIAQMLGENVLALPHDSFFNLAARPVDTTYDAAGTRWKTGLEEGLRECRQDFISRGTRDIVERSKEIAAFLHISEASALERLRQGFAANHQAVNDEYRKANCKSDDTILDWYRSTEQYIWELSAYHLDERFNYAGQCRGIIERLKAAGARDVLCLGDGIGDLTADMRAAGMNAWYNDLAGSRTAAFARFRYWMRTGDDLPSVLTSGWSPDIGGPWDAIVSLDFLEHVTDVPSWVQRIKESLAPSGLFCAQNAFALGSGDNGSIPMHLVRNDRFEKDWDPMLNAFGFSQESSNWYRAAV